MDMGKDNLKERCEVNTNFDENTFVGIQCENEKIKVTFPLGFNLSDSDQELRRDILLLLETLRIHTEKTESRVNQPDIDKYELVNLPVQAYLAVIYDYYSRGYYKERETIYSNAKRGKIDWNRTIKKNIKYLQDDEVLFLDFTTRRNQIKDNELITMIHEYCVYESFRKLGWIFTEYVPPKPRIAFNYRLFKSTITERLLRTFDDKNKQLFQNMLAIINVQSNPDAKNDYQYGTYRFEYVWESMIDKVFGEESKEDYFPVSSWSTITGDKLNHSLEPDSIMIKGDKIYILDAKYYKYGLTGYLSHLPESSSINKQITYGEFVEQLGFAHERIYNAFLLPFNQFDNPFKTKKEIMKIGEAKGNWKNGNKNYESIQGVVLDVKSLMKVSRWKNTLEILKLVECIEGLAK